MDLGWGLGGSLVGIRWGWISKWGVGRGWFWSCTRWGGDGDENWTRRGDGDGDGDENIRWGLGWDGQHPLRPAPLTTLMARPRPCLARPRNFGFLRSSRGFVRLLRSHDYDVYEH